MSYYTPEASLINYRIAVIATESKDLANLFESWAMEIEADLQPNLKPQLRYLANFKDAEDKKTSGGAKAWLSATLGSRGTLGLRVTLIGYDASFGLPQEAFLRNLDGLWVWANPESKNLSEILRIGSSAAPVEIPTLVMFSRQEEGFLSKAVELWSKRQVQPSKIHIGHENSLRKGLEWALSFS